MLRRSLVLLAASAALAIGQGTFKAELSGYNEVSAVSTTGSGEITVAATSNQSTLSITLTFSNLAGVAQSAQLYFGASGTNGGALAYLCGGSKPTCPNSAGGTVTVSLAASDVLAAPAQGIAAGNIADLIHAMEAGAVYVNIVTTKFPNGEVRGQLGRGHGPPPGKGKGNGND